MTLLIGYRGLCKRMLKLSRSNDIGISSMERMSLEEYNVAIQDFHDSLKGLDSAIQEALDRCDKARLACGEARLVFEDKQAERATSRSQFRCRERTGSRNNIC